MYFQIVDSKASSFDISDPEPLNHLITPSKKDVVLHEKNNEPTFLAPASTSHSSDDFEVLSKRLEEQYQPQVSFIFLKHLKFKKNSASFT